MSTYGFPLLVFIENSYENVLKNPLKAFTDRRQIPVGEEREWEGGAALEA
jgi:hypothetical protein